MQTKDTFLTIKLHAIIVSILLILITRIYFNFTDSVSAVAGEIDTPVAVKTKNTNRGTTIYVSDSFSKVKDSVNRVSFLEFQISTTPNFLLSWTFQQTPQRRGTILNCSVPSTLHFRVRAGTNTSSGILYSKWVTPAEDKTSISYKSAISSSLESVTDKTATLSWSAVSGNGYVIYRSSGFSKPVKVAEINSSSTTTFTDKELTPKSSYRYYVYSVTKATVTDVTNKNISELNLDQTKPTHVITNGSLKSQQIVVTDKNVSVGKTVALNAKSTSGLKLTYNSADASIAAVNSNGIVKGIKKGTTTITITQPRNASYSPVTKKVTIKVVAGITNPSVIFVGNGGKTASRLKSLTQTVKYNTKISLKGNSFKKKGYVFAGWAKSPKGKVRYKNKGPIKVKTNIKLYAKWEKDYGNAIRVLFIGNSYQFYHSVWWQFKDIAQANRKNVHVSYLTKPASSVPRIIKARKAGWNKFKKQKWDFIVLQNHMRGKEDSWFKTTMNNATKRLKKMVSRRTKHIIMTKTQYPHREGRLRQWVRKNKTSYVTTRYMYGVSMAHRHRDDSRHPKAEVQASYAYSIYVKIFGDSTKRHKKGISSKGKKLFNSHRKYSVGKDTLNRIRTKANKTWSKIR